MTSILTNLSSMTALQTLKGINKSLNMVQGEVSSGLKIANAKDNASVWAIAATMRSDVSSYKQINDGLGTALAAVNVGRNATETISELLKEMRAKIVAAGTLGTDTAKTQTDIDNLRLQIQSVVEAASFNGINFVNSGAAINVLTSVDRTSGVVATDDKYVEVESVDMTLDAAVAARANALTSGVAANTADGNMLVAFTMDAAEAAAETLTIDATDFVVGDRIEVTIGTQTASYTVTQGDIDETTIADRSAVIAVKLKDAIDALAVTGVEIDYDNTDPDELTFDNDLADAVSRTVMVRIIPANDENLSALTGVAVDTEINRTAALEIVDDALDYVIAGAASLGSNQKRLEIQQEFITKLSDNLSVGIGALVDADMEEASARLAALQTQQQLGIQSLSIANQSPQSIMALFR